MALITDKVKMREEFEAWWRRECENTLYCESAWRGWQASRAALVVKLPFEFASGMIRLSPPSKPQE